jgi:hypothetical protein
MHWFMQKRGADRFHWALLRLGSAELMLNTAYEFDNHCPLNLTMLASPLTTIQACFFGCRRSMQHMKSCAARA